MKRANAANLLGQTNIQQWQCGACTYLNAQGFCRCIICFSLRPPSVVTTRRRKASSQFPSTSASIVDSNSTRKKRSHVAVSRSPNKCDGGARKLQQESWIANKKEGGLLKRKLLDSSASVSGKRALNVMKTIAKCKPSTKKVVVHPTTSTDRRGSKHESVLSIDKKRMNQSVSLCDTRQLSKSCDTSTTRLTNGSKSGSVKKGFLCGPLTLKCKDLAFNLVDVSTNDSLSSEDASSEQKTHIDTCLDTDDNVSVTTDATTMQRKTTQIPSNQSSLFESRSIIHPRPDMQIEWSLSLIQFALTRQAVKPGGYWTLELWKAWLDFTVNEINKGWSNVEGHSVQEGNRHLSTRSIGLGARASKLDQVTAQYGRANSDLVQLVVEKTGLTKRQKFADVGSGIGQVVLQVATTVQCEAFGVELMAARHNTAVRFFALLEDFKERTLRTCGSCQVVHGDFRDPSTWEQLVDADVLFVNNANDTFGVRSVKKGCHTLNYYAANLVFERKLGSQSVFFDRVPEIDIMVRHGAFRHSVIHCGANSVSWTSKPVDLHHYVKVRNHWRCTRCNADTPLQQKSGESRSLKCEVCSSQPYCFRQNRNKRS